MNNNRCIYGKIDGRQRTIVVYCEFRWKWPVFKWKTVLKKRPFQQKFAVIEYRWSLRVSFLRMMCLQPAQGRASARACGTLGIRCSSAQGRNALTRKHASKLGSLLDPFIHRSIIPLPLISRDVSELLNICYGCRYDDFVLSHLGYWTDNGAYCQ